MMSEIRVLLVDDHAVVRAGLRMLLQAQADIEIVGEAENGEQALAQLAETAPDVVVMDITMPDMDGFEATRRIKAQSPQTAVLALTIHEADEFFFEMLAAGASGYVPKRAAPVDLVTAIRAVHEGGVFLYPTVAKSVVQSLLAGSGSGGRSGVPNGLTERERQVLTLIAEGCMNQEIAARLAISAKTVARHRENIMRKLNLHSRTDLVKYAIRRGLIDLED